MHSFTCYLYFCYLPVRRPVCVCVCTASGVHGFTLDPTIGEFVLTHPNVRIPRRGRIYSFNEANEFKWPAGLRKYVEDIKLGRGETKLSYTSRYIGSMVGDIHRTLLYGGIFGYPADSKRPRGKLRLLHEVAPLSFLIEQVRLQDHSHPQCHSLYRWTGRCQLVPHAPCT